MIFNGIAVLLLRIANNTKQVCRKLKISFSLFIESWSISVHEYVSLQHVVLAEGRFLRSVLVNRRHGVTWRYVKIANCYHSSVFKILITMSELVWMYLNTLYIGSPNTVSLLECKYGLTATNERLMHQVKIVKQHLRQEEMRIIKCPG